VSWERRSGRNPRTDTFSFYEALLIPFEISAFALVLGFWSDKTQETGPLAGIIIGVICCYA
jgi:amino acid transporter